MRSNYQHPSNLDKAFSAFEQAIEDKQQPEEQPVPPLVEYQYVNPQQQIVQYQPQHIQQQINHYGPTSEQQMMQIILDQQAMLQNQVFEIQNRDNNLANLAHQYRASKQEYNTLNTQYMHALNQSEFLAVENKKLQSSLSEEKEKNETLETANGILKRQLIEERKKNPAKRQKIEDILNPTDISVSPTTPPAGPHSFIVENPAQPAPDLSPVIRKFTDGLTSNPEHVRVPTLTRAGSTASERSGRN